MIIFQQHSHHNFLARSLRDCNKCPGRHLLRAGRPRWGHIELFASFQWHRIDRLQSRRCWAPIKRATGRRPGRSTHLSEVSFRRPQVRARARSLARLLSGQRDRLLRDSRSPSSSASLFEWGRKGSQNRRTSTGPSRARARFIASLARPDRDHRPLARWAHRAGQVQVDVVGLKFRNFCPPLEQEPKPRGPLVWCAN